MTPYNPVRDTNFASTCLSNPPSNPQFRPSHPLLQLRTSSGLLHPPTLAFAMPYRLSTLPAFGPGVPPSLARDVFSPPPFRALQPRHAPPPAVARVRARSARPLACAAPTAPRGPVLQEASVTVGDAVVSLRVEDLGGRRRRVSGGIDIESGVARVWYLLTQYGVMDRYMPNITSSEVFSRDGNVFLDQVGVISRRLRMTSRMVMRVVERPKEEIRFSRVEGRDFSEFEGKYMFRESEGGGCRLDYELIAVPMPLFPVGLVERKIIKEVPAMLAAVREEAREGRVVKVGGE